MRPKLFLRTPFHRWWGAILSTVALAVVGGVALTPAVAAPATEKHFDDWSFGCAPVNEKTGGKGKEMCQMYQLVMDKKAGKPVMNMMISRLPGQEKPLMEVIVPMGVLLVPGIRIRVDNAKEAFSLPFVVCTRQGCSAMHLLTDRVIEQFKHGQKLIVSFIAPERHRIDREVSLNGFSAAYAALAQKK